MAAKSYSIYCLLKNSKLIEQATVVEEDSTEYKLDLVKLDDSILHMSEYITELFNLMIIYGQQYPYNSNLYKTKKYKFTNNEYIRGIIYHRVHMRKGSYFYVLQQSDRGIRFLLYAIDVVNHSSCAFGNAMRLPEVSEQLKLMKDELKKYNIKQFEDEFQIPIEELNKLINNESLYFI